MLAHSITFVTILFLCNSYFEGISALKILLRVKECLGTPKIATQTGSKVQSYAQNPTS